MWIACNSEYYCNGIAVYNLSQRILLKGMIQFPDKTETLRNDPLWLKNSIIGFFGSPITIGNSCKAISKSLLRLAWQSSKRDFSWSLHSDIAGLQWRCQMFILDTDGNGKAICGVFGHEWSVADPLYKWTNEILFAVLLVSLPRTHAAARLSEVHAKPFGVYVVSSSLNDEKPHAASVSEALSSTPSAPGRASPPTPT